MTHPPMQQQDAPRTRPLKVIPRREVLKVTGLDRDDLYHRVRRGYFPEPVDVGVGRDLWLEFEVLEWKRKFCR